MTPLFLIAFATNCVSIERAEIEWTVAAQGPDSGWYDWDGREFRPFWTISFDDLAKGFIWEDVTMPPGWIEHIQSIARHNMRKHAEPTFDLAAAMRLGKAPAKPFPRRL